MRIENIKALKGDNLYTNAPVLVMTLNLEELAGKETHEVTGFMDQLLTLLPGIIHHHCANGKTGELAEPARATIGFDHITARVALELATLADIPVHYARTLSPDGPQHCKVIVEFTTEAGMRFLLRTAVKVIEALISGRTPRLEERLAAARDLIRRTASEAGARKQVGAAARWV